MAVEGCDVVGCLWGSARTCGTRPVEGDVEVHDAVRVDLPGATLYGIVLQAEEDRVQVRVSDGQRLPWAERWRLILY
ncbi:hypothetical protein HBB06_30440 [Streptomyces sp. SNU607]|nr:hypothetical protein [Streptomyces sp. SID7834]MYT59184.1 hypothetical protein [Streptomyces sp. SID7834]WKV82485.1 hypothetical protein HBB06_30440 [Streptomyces sp. SNU607]